MRHKVWGGRLAAQRALAVKRLWAWVEEDEIKQASAAAQMLAELRPEHLGRRLVADRMAKGLATLLERRLEIGPVFRSLVASMRMPAFAEAEDLAQAACNCLQSLVQTVAELGNAGQRDLAGARKAQTDLNREAAKLARDLAATLTGLQRKAEGQQYLDCYPLQAMAPHHLMLAAGQDHQQFLLRAHDALAAEASKHWRPRHWPSMPAVLVEMADQFDAHEVRPRGEAAIAASGKVGAAGLLRLVLTLMAEGEPDSWPPIKLTAEEVASLVSALDVRLVGSPSPAQVYMARKELRQIEDSTRLELLEARSLEEGESGDIYFNFTVDAP